MKLIYAGIILIFLGIIITSIASFTTNNVTTTTTSSGFTGVIFIGPFPIVFGVGNPSVMPYLFIFGIIFTLIALLFFILPWILYEKSSKSQS